MGEKNRIGNFVEIKNSKTQENTKAAHLSYIGDSIVGKECKLWLWFNYSEL